VVFRIEAGIVGIAAQRIAYGPSDGWTSDAAVEELTATCYSREKSAILAVAFSVISRENLLLGLPEAVAMDPLPFLYRRMIVCLVFLLSPALPVTLAQVTTEGGHPSLESKEFRADPSPQRLERGRYLVEGVAFCFHCHSKPDYENGHGQPTPGTRGAGRIVKGEVFDGEAFPDGLVCPNITPDKETGAGTWSDAQFERAIRHGIGHDGRQLLDYMPYAFFRSMTDEDVASVIVYIKSIPAIRNPLPKRNLPFEVKSDLHPEMEPKLPANASEEIKRGWYLVRIAQCNDCHTSANPDGSANTEMMFGGGYRMKGAWGDVVTPNITSDPSGIAHYDADMFIKTIRTGNASGGVRELNPLMPYSFFRNMSDEDLKAIFAYLRTVPPVRHHEDNSEPPTYCPICRQKHGFGDKN
jgi:mono/diheme cytochrome c family protein